MGETQRGKTVLAGHGLVTEGAAHDENGKRVYNPTPFGNKGRALCSCGALSDELASTKARQRWHQQHKEEIRNAGS